MSSESILRVVVASRRVPTGTTQVELPIFGQSGLRIGSRKVSHVFYRDELDPSQRQMLDEARRLSRSLGLRLEVVDRSKAGVLRRALGALASAGRSGPSLVFSPQHKSQTGGNFASNELIVQAT